MKWPFITWTSFYIKPKLITNHLDFPAVIYVKLCHVSKRGYDTTTLNTTQTLKELISGMQWKLHSNISEIS